MRRDEDVQRATHKIASLKDGEANGDGLVVVFTHSTSDDTRRPKTNKSPQRV
jgi:hypothetical protein